MKKNDIGKDEEIDIQLAENQNIDSYEESYESFKQKRELLEKTKILKQTWSILEIYRKLKGKKLILDPIYQRNVIWPEDKQTSFIESIIMDIIVPPIYVVEIVGTNRLDDIKYEVVDGKQRLSAILSFIENKLYLKRNTLEYYADIFGGKNFDTIEEEFGETIQAFLSSVLDVYVITANSPEFTKYDIFSRLNKGSEKLRVNEIRKAIYQSPSLIIINEFVTECLKEENKIKDDYTKLFSENDIKRYEDYGRFYRSIAFYLNSNIQKEEVSEYKSRPRDMINTVLQRLQNNSSIIDNNTLNKILTYTVKLGVVLKDNVEKNKLHYILDCCIPFINNFEFEELAKKTLQLTQNQEFDETFSRSPSTTTNVNNRLKIAKTIFL